MIRGPRWGLLLLGLALVGCVAGPPSNDRADAERRHAELKRYERQLEAECTALRQQLDDATRVERAELVGAAFNPEETVAVEAPERPGRDMSTADEIDPDSIAVRILAEEVGFYGIGQTHFDEVPDALRALRVILGRPDAVDVFLALYERAKPAGQLYALAGLAVTAPDEFEARVEAARNRTERVAYAPFGYYLRDHPFGALVDECLLHPDLRSAMVEVDADAIPSFRDADDDVARWRPIARNARHWIERLTRQLEAEAGDDETAALEALLLVGPYAPETLATVVSCLHDEHPLVRSQARRALTILAPWSSRTLPSLLRLLERGSEPAIYELTELIRDERLWRFAPREQVEAALKPGYLEGCAALDEEDALEIRSAIFEGLWARTDLAELSRSTFMSVLSSLDDDDRIRWVASYLMRGGTAVERLAEWAPAEPEIVAVLRSPYVAPWLPDLLRECVDAPAENANTAQSR